MKNERNILAGKFMQLILVVSLVIFIILFLRSHGEMKEVSNLYEAASDTLRSERNKLGQEVSRVQLLQATSKKDFLKLKSQDETINKLQEIIKEYDGKLQSAISLANSTTNKGNTVTVIEKWDTLETDTGRTIYPQYVTSWKEKWSEGVITATKDSIHRDIKVNNEFEITFGKENNSPFKKRKSEVKIVNLNPNTVTDEMRAFNIEHKQKRVSLGIQFGYGMTNTGLSPYVGLGVNINLIGIK